MKSNYYPVLSEAIDHYGKSSQILMAFEEMSELQKELCKNARGERNTSHIVEEIADVEIMLAQLKLIFNCGVEVNNWTKRKIERLSSRMKGE